MWLTQLCNIWQPQVWICRSTQLITQTMRSLVLTFLQSQYQKLKHGFCLHYRSYNSRSSHSSAITHRPSFSTRHSYQSLVPWFGQSKHSAWVTYGQYADPVERFTCALIRAVQQLTRVSLIVIKSYNSHGIHSFAITDRYWSAIADRPSYSIQTHLSIAGTCICNPNSQAWVTSN